MNYCTAPDVVAYYKSARLAALLDRVEEGLELDSQLLACIEAANGEVDSYVRRQNSLPLLTVPPHLKMTAARLAIVEIMRARSAKMPEAQADWYQRDVDYLKSIASGDVVLEFESKLQDSQATGPATLATSIVETPETLFNESYFRNYFG